MWKGSSSGRAFFASLVASCIVAIALAQDTGIEGSSSSLIFNPDPRVVNQGERLSLDCGVKGTYRYCIWDRGGEHQQSFQVQDVEEKIIKGLSRPETTNGNQCGIVINAVTASDNGDWTCKVFVVGQTLRATKNIIVTIQPEPPILNLRESPLVISEDEEKEISCTVPKARPAARVRWFIGTEDVSSRSLTENTPIDGMETYSSVSTLRYRFHHTEDRKFLKCSIEHPTLYEAEYAEVQLDIRYQPYPISSTKIYGVPLEKEFEIKYNFTSNPVPDMRWYVQGFEIPVPGESGRYMANIKTLKDNIYMATLKIREFTQQDVGVNYRLYTKNDLGEREFTITLSTGPAPPDDGFYGSNEIDSSPENFDSEDTVGQGTMAAIVIIVILILVLLMIIGVMRYRQMYCFSRKDKIKNHMKDSGENLKEEGSDTESAAREPPTSKKGSSLFRNFRAIIPVSQKKPKETRLDKAEEGESDKEGKMEGEGGENGKTNTEIVYAELELGKGEKKERNGRENEATEYAEIVGTVPDNRRRKD